ncbi:MAG: hypothetical protein AMXMBFR7_28510 [Planctomycetota bacterium]
MKRWTGSEGSAGTGIGADAWAMSGRAFQPWGKGKRKPPKDASEGLIFNFSAGNRRKTGRRKVKKKAPAPFQGPARYG